MVAAVLAVTTSCAIENQSAPALAGPSEYGLGMSVTASPDLIKPDSVSVIAVHTFDAEGGALPSVSLRLRVSSGSGTLSETAGTTDGNGGFAVVYTAPAGDTVATIEVMTVNSNAQVTRMRTVSVRVRS
jgi:hypothetical protein